VLAGEGEAGGVVAALAAGAVGVVSLPTAQAVEGGDARCDALDVELFAEVLETVVLDVMGGTDEVVAPDPENGTNTSIESEVLCPAAGTGAPTASASANLTVGGEVIELNTDLGDLVAEQNVDFAVDGVLEGVLNVRAETSAMADDDSAEATGLELTLTFSGSLLGQSVVLTLGTITFAETSCTVGAPEGVPPTDPTAPPTEPTGPGGTLPPTR